MHRIAFRGYLLVEAGSYDDAEALVDLAQVHGDKHQAFFQGHNGVTQIEEYDDGEPDE
jgi:hypothetical protein